MSVLAIDVGGTKFSVALFEGDEIVQRESHATNRVAGRDWMLDQLTMIGRRWKRMWQIDRCGIGFGGPVDYTNQRVALSTHVGGWQDFALPNYMDAVLGIPSIMDNDANVGALGEAINGAAMGCSNVFYMTLSTGIGGGILIEGKPYRGACDLRRSRRTRRPPASPARRRARPDRAPRAAPPLPAAPAGSSAWRCAGITPRPGSSSTTARCAP